MIVRIVTDCHFAGCETIHYVELEDGMTEEEIQEYADEVMQQDIEPQVTWDIVMKRKRRIWDMILNKI